MRCLDVADERVAEGTDRVGDLAMRLRDEIVGEARGEFAAGEAVVGEEHGEGKAVGVNAARASHIGKFSVVKSQKKKKARKTRKSTEKTRKKEQ